MLDNLENSKFKNLSCTSLVGGGSRFFSMGFTIASPTLMCWVNQRRALIGHGDEANNMVELLLLILSLFFRDEGVAPVVFSLHSDDQLRPVGLWPSSPIKGKTYDLRTCAAPGSAVDLQTRQVVPTAPLPTPDPHSSAPGYASSLHFTHPRLLVVFYHQEREACFFLNCPLNVDFGRLSISITLTAMLSSPGKVFTRWRSPFRVI